MLNSKLKRTSLALLLAVVLMLSLFPVAAFALEDAGAASEDEAGIVLDASQTTDTSEADAETDAETNAETEAEASGDTAADEHDHDHDHEDEGTAGEGEDTTEEEKGMSLGDIISLAVLGVVIILVVIYCLTHKEKVAKLFRGLKSELKKIVWTPWNQVRKNTVVVLVIIIATIIVIGVLDFLFSRGILALGKIF